MNEGVSLFAMRLLILFAAKTMSYGASTAYHLSVNVPLVQELKLLYWDLFFIPVAMWAMAQVFTKTLAEWVGLCAIMLIVALVNHTIIQQELHHISTCTPNTKTERKRALLLVLYFIFNVGFIAVQYGIDEFWVAGVLLYSCSFFASPFFYRNYAAAFWHVADINGWHEDFHALLFGADVIFTRMAIEYVDNLLS